MRQVSITPQGTTNYKVIFGAIIGLILLISAILSFLFFSREKEQPNATNPNKLLPTSTLADGIPESREIWLYFVHPDSAELVIDKRSVFLKGDFIESLKHIIQELIKGSTAGLINPIPDGVQLRGAFFNPKTGCAYVDFSDTLLQAHIGGITAELLTIQSIIKTLKANFSEKIQMVQILIDGKEAATIAGHIDISHPLYLEK